MKPIHKIYFITTFLSLSLQPKMSFAGAEADEQSSYQIQRTQQTSNSLQFTLSKNVYRQEPYQANYEVQIPYESTETYNVDVPYDVTVPYQDTEIYYDSEYQCRTETHYHTECHPRTDCDFVGNNNFVHDERHDRDDHDGRGHHGGHRGGEGPRQNQCHVENSCETVPYQERECGYVNVPKTRWVTRYRTETRYRSEERTRTVTNYRSETRCCETKTKSVFDHQYAINVSLKLPKVNLLKNESDNLNFELQGTQETPTINVTTNNTVYKYVVTKNEITGANADIELTIAPQFDRLNAGYKSIGNFSIIKQGNTSVLILNDSIINPHVQTSYTVKINDLKEILVATGQGKNTGTNKVMIVLNKDLTKFGPAVIELGVTRTGDLFKDNGLQFKTFEGIVIK